MANTYSQISIHAVFAVKFRENVITKEWRDDLHKYISGILKNEPISFGISSREMAPDTTSSTKLVSTGLLVRALIDASILFFISEMKTLAKDSSK